MAKGRQNMWFALATNSAIDLGFVVGAFIPWLCVYVSRAILISQDAESRATGRRNTKRVGVHVSVSVSSGPSSYSSSDF